jgi:hypothetical protein
MATTKRITSLYFLATLLFLTFGNHASSQTIRETFVLWDSGYCCLGDPANANAIRANARDFAQGQLFWRSHRVHMFAQGADGSSARLECLRGSSEEPAQCFMVEQCAPGSLSCHQNYQEALDAHLDAYNDAQSGTTGGGWNGGPIYVPTIVRLYGWSFRCSVGGQEISCDEYTTT